MGRQVASVLYVVAMAAVIVGVDFVFFRNRFWERLTADSEYWNRLGIRSVLLEIPEASMNKGRQRSFAAIVQTHFDEALAADG